MPPEHVTQAEMVRMLDGLQRAVHNLVEYTHTLHKRLVILEREARDRLAAEFAKQEAK